jgi:iron-sulfur cluster assembly accessory protein
VPYRSIRISLVADSSALQLTERAVRHVRAIQEREHLTGRGLRVSLSAGGCSGYSYKLDFDEGPTPDDTVLEQDGLTIYVRTPLLQQLRGTVIDYVAALHGASFQFSNPNATGTCGCGTSFSV